LKIGVVGTGYVGLVVGTCLADLGNDVICLDVDEQKIKQLNQGKLPIYEPGLEELLKRSLKEGRLTFTTDAQKAVQASQVLFIAVGTPSQADGSVDLSFVEKAAAEIGQHMNEFKVIVEKSTVPVGTHQLVERLVKENQKEKHAFEVVSNPEFLREGSAIKDFMAPDRIVVGLPENSQAKEIMENLYKGIARADKPLVFTSVQTAELIKYASNAMLATRISFINELARLCEKVDADVKDVAKGMGLDKRIGPRFLQAGLGYGGSCLPKDVKALISTGKKVGSDFSILEAVEKVNDAQRESLLPKIKQLVPELKDKTIAVWGLAFKPKTDDIRQASSLAVIERLLAEGARVKAFDPEAVDNARKVLGNKIEYCATALEAVAEADCLVLITEWDEFRNPDFEKIKKAMKQPNLLDGRNIYDPKRIQQLGFNYLSMGR
jgi:UDPglucose 6-dehydrogenase